MTRWFARRGAVGSTARWAAKTYKFVQNRYESLGPKPEEFYYRGMISFRYENFPNDTHQEYLGERASEVQGLMGLVVEILKVEAKLAENETRLLPDMLDVIAEELFKARFSEEEIFGEFKGPHDYLETAGARPDLF